MEVVISKKYSLRDNPTGIYATPGEKLFVALDDVYEGADISILVLFLCVSFEDSKGMLSSTWFNT